MSANVSPEKSGTSQDQRPRVKVRRRPMPLSNRALQMIRLLVWGSPVDRTKTPWGIYEAAYAVGYSRRAARELAMSPEFIAAYEREKDGRGNAGMIPSLDDVRREMRRRRGKTARPSPEAVAATAQPAPLASGWIIKLYQEADD